MKYFKYDKTQINQKTGTEDIRNGPDLLSLNL